MRIRQRSIDFVAIIEQYRLELHSDRVMLTTAIHTRQPK
jgi:hypothetical protein